MISLPKTGISIENGFFNFKATNGEPIAQFPVNETRNLKIETQWNLFKALPAITMLCGVFIPLFFFKYFPENFLFISFLLFLGCLPYVHQIRNRIISLNLAYGELDYPFADKKSLIKPFDIFFRKALAKDTEVILRSDVSLPDGSLSINQGKIVQTSKKAEIFKLPLSEVQEATLNYKHNFISLMIYTLCLLYIPFNLLTNHGSTINFAALFLSISIFASLIIDTFFDGKKPVLSIYSDNECIDIPLKCNKWLAQIFFYDLKSRLENRAQYDSFS